MKSTFKYISLIAAMLILVLCSGVYAQKSDKLRGIKLSGNPDTPHKVFVVFDSTPGQSENNLVKGLGGSIRYTYRIVPAIAATIPEAAIEGLRKNPNVTAIEAVGKVTAINDTYDTYPWGILRIGSDIAHKKDYKGFGVKVAIIDSGIAFDHPDLKANYEGGYDFSNGDSDPYDDYGHGTHVAGIVAADDNSSGIIGVAPNALLFALKVLDASGSGWDYDIVAALDWISVYNETNGDDPIRITNNSYAGVDPDATGDDQLTTVEQAFINLYNQGVLHVAAAGNSGNVPGRGDNVDYPARFASVIAVAATTDSEDNKRASFSSTGPDVELSAPGVNINSTVPGDENSYSTALKSGTSMASPHVVGVAALVMATGMTTDPDQVRYRLILTADDLGDTGKDTKYGWGLVDADEAADLVPVDAFPVISITDPIDGAIVKGSYTVIVEATDDDPTELSVNLSIDEIDPASILMDEQEDGSWTYLWETTGFSEGSHTLEATATDSALQKTKTPIIKVTVKNYTPTASFTYSCSGLDCNFDASGSTDPNDDEITYSWNFGEESSDAGTGVNPTHTYSGDGDYNVTLTVTDPDGYSDTAMEIVTVTSDSTSAMHIGDITMSSKKAGPNVNAIATILVVDDFDNPVEGAEVSGDWTGLTTDSDTGTTNSSGTVSLSSDELKRNTTGIFTFTVKSISKTGWEYKEGDLRSASITVSK